MSFQLFTLLTIFYELINAEIILINLIAIGKLLLFYYCLYVLLSRKNFIGQNAFMFIRCDNCDFSS